MLAPLRPLLLAVAFAVLPAACSRPARTTPASPAASVASPALAADRSRGAKIFAANCAQCHGVRGTEGGVGPSLRGEKVRKDLGATIVAIERPEPPMPKLYPGTLDERDVADVAAYVRSL